MACHEASIDGALAELDYTVFDEGGAEWPSYSTGTEGRWLWRCPTDRRGKAPDPFSATPPVAEDTALSKTGTLSRNHASFYVPLMGSP